ncbi:MAG: lipopolysaccharide kinase [Gemmatimonadetes bacterium]|nr:lipopolysaccharide kinase [Gemmatimonadota bacterium]
MTAPPPAGYVQVAAGRCSAIVLEGHEHDASALLAEGTLYEAAARDLGARPLAGRGIAYAIALPATGTHAVVRHNRHGGLLAPLTRDLFLPPTRAPYELATSLRLLAAGVRTPRVLMYGVERKAFVLRRADVVTRVVEDARDLATYMQPREPHADRTAAWQAARALVDSLDAAGARHHDLNVKNILIARERTGLEAWVLDVDRVEFTTASAARAGNRARLLRSARKWRDERGAAFDEGADY